MWKKRERKVVEEKVSSNNIFFLKKSICWSSFCVCALLATSERSDPPTTTLPDVARGVPLIAVMAVYPDSHDLYGLEEVRILHMGGRSAVGFR